MGLNFVGYVSVNFGLSGCILGAWTAVEIAMRYFVVLPHIFSIFKCSSGVLYCLDMPLNEKNTSFKPVCVFSPPTVGENGHEEVEARLLTLQARVLLGTLWLIRISIFLTACQLWQTCILRSRGLVFRSLAWDRNYRLTRPPGTEGTKYLTAEQNFLTNICRENACFAVPYYNILTVISLREQLDVCPGALTTAPGEIPLATSSSGLNDFLFCYSFVNFEVVSFLASVATSVIVGWMMVKVIDMTVSGLFLLRIRGSRAILQILLVLGLIVWTVLMVIPMKVYQLLPKLNLVLNGGWIPSAMLMTIPVALLICTTVAHNLIEIQTLLVQHFTPQFRDLHHLYHMQRPEILSRPASPELPIVTH